MNAASAATDPAAPGASPLDRFLPRADVRERHEILVHAPAAVVLDTARQFDLESIPAVRAIFAARAWIMGSRRPRREPAGLVEMTRGLGWGVLVEEEGRYYCAGAVCRPWLADVEFRPLPPEDFAAYAEPGRIKIVWTLEAEPDVRGTRFATETRVAATNEAARRRFLRYWRLASPGILLIRKLLLPAVRREAERRSKAADAAVDSYASFAATPPRRIFLDMNERDRMGRRNHP